MNRFIHTILIITLAAASVLLTGCKSVKDISVTSVKVEAIAPQGLTALNIFIAVGVDNPAFQIGLEDIEGHLKHSGKVLGILTVDPFVLQARSAEIYHLRTTARLGGEATLRDLMMLTDMQKLNECMVDVSLKARLKSGAAAPITIKDIPLKKLLESAANEKK